MVDIGWMLGDWYRFVEPLPGGRGDVWRAVDVDSGARVTVMILPAIDIEAERIEELQALTNADDSERSKKAPKIYDWGVDETIGGFLITEPAEDEHGARRLVTAYFGFITFLLYEDHLALDGSPFGRTTVNPPILLSPRRDGYAFISYSHRHDGGYVEALANYLARAGVPVWFDKEVISGERWATVIRDQIDSCAAFILVMTADADESAWVARELARAEEQGREIVPLLLDGEPMFSVGHIHYENVTGGKMPSEQFLTRLRALCG